MAIDYHHPLYRPPSEGENLIIQATLGCSFNRCAFCAMYRDQHYTARPAEAVSRDIATAGREWPAAQRVFLADGDALALPTDRLLELLDELHASLPRLGRVACYATPGNLRQKSVEELTQLREAGLKLLYLGIESGSDALLKRVAKGATAQGIGEGLEKAADAGFKVSATVILGLGGLRHSSEHIDGTIELLNRAPLTYLSTLQLTLDPSLQQSYLDRFDGSYQDADDLAILDEQRRLIAGLTPPRPIIFRSNHASNALALAGNLPRDRERLLGEIEAAIGGERALRPHHLRSM